MWSDEDGGSRRGRALVLADILLIVLLASALVLPVFSAGYARNWASIESTFIADGRFLAEHWPHPLWQPLWYGGTRFDYVYPPVVRYGTAALIRAAGLPPVRAYHVLIALFYAIGIAGVYVLIRSGSGSRRAGWVGTAAAALISPCFLLMPVYRHDSPHLTPQRLHALLEYGEGPHVCALAFLTLALAAGFVALRGRQPAALALTAVLAAGVALTNFHAAAALVILFSILAWSVWVTHRDGRVWLRAAAIAVLAYGLAAFWLVPSYLRITLANLDLVAERANAWPAMAAAAAIFAWLSWRWARGRKERDWAVFVCGAAWLFAVPVLGQSYFGVRAIGDPHRFLPEFDLALILLGVEGLRLLWKARWERFGWAPRTAAIAILLVSFAPGRHYLRHAWEVYPLDPDYTRRVEYRIPERIARELPGARAFVSGSIRFWYDTWRDLAQAGGGSEQGLINRNAVPAAWEIQLGPRPEPGVLWMKCLGVDAVVVPDKSSREMYHDFKYPRKFAGALPVLYDDGEGDVIYRVPRHYRAAVRVVERARAEALQPVRFNDDVERLAPYADTVENGPASPVEMAWLGTDAIRLRAAVAADRCLLVQASYDPAWRAYAGGKRIPIRRDALGQMLVYPPPGAGEATLRFELPLENWIGRVVSILSLMVVGMLIVAQSVLPRLHAAIRRA
jgi:hypothetical protein